MASQDLQTFHWHYSEFNDRNFQIRGRTFFYAVVLFTIILLTSLLLLFARWLCRIRPTSAPYLAHPPPPSQPRGLDVATINSFPIVLHHSSTSTADFGESECCICLGLFEDGEKVKVLPKCRHFYHPVCVDKWLCSQSSCPICRSSLRVDSPV